MGKDGSAPAGAALPALLGPVVVVLGWRAMFAAGSAVGSQGLRPLLLASELGLALPGLLTLALFRIPIVKALALRPLDRRTAFISLGAGACFWAASLGLFELQYTIWRPPLGYLESFRHLHDALAPAGPLDALLSVTAIALAPAFFEEVLFRGIVLPSFAPARWPAAAVIGSALLFGLIHLDPSTPGAAALYRVPFAFAVGIGLGLLRIGTGALLPSILAHALLNTMTFIAAPFTEDPAQGMPPAQPLLGALLLIGGGLVAGVLLGRLRRIDSAAAST